MIQKKIEESQKAQINQTSECITKLQEQLSKELSYLRSENDEKFKQMMSQLVSVKSNHIDEVKEEDNKDE